MSKRSRRNRKKKPPPDTTIKTDSDEEEGLSSRVQLAHLNLYAKAARNEEERKEIALEKKKLERKLKPHWYSKPLFLQTTIAGIIAASVLWFYVKDVALPLSGREREKLDEMILQHEVDVETFMQEKDLLVEKNAILEKEFSEKNVKMEQEYKHKIKTLDGTHAKKMSALKEEHTEKNKELKKSFEDISSFDNWYSRGVGEFIDGKNAKAIDSFNKALETNPDTVPAAFTHNYIGLSNERRGKAREAVENYTRAIEIYKEYADAYMNRGSAYLRLKEYEKAFKDAYRAIAFLIIKGEYIAAKEHIEDKLQGLKRVETDEKFDENMKKSAENHITTLKKQLEEAQKRTTE